MKRFFLWGVGIIVVIVIACVGLYKVRPDIVMLRVAPIITAIRKPVGPARPIHWKQGPATASKPASQRSPNIVVIIADDLGWNGVSRNGGIANGGVPTPNINAIAQNGVEFAKSYAANAVCAPARASIMTGRYATRFGYEFTPVPNLMIPVVVSLINHDSHFKRKPIELPHANNLDFHHLGMPTSEITMGQELQKAGYHTVMVGKWHLGETGKYAPINRGFDESLQLAGLLHGHKDDPDIVNAKMKFDPIDKFLWAVGREAVSFNSGPRFSPKEYLSKYFTDQAVKVIHNNRNRPFFLYLAYWNVHAPLQATKADYDALSHIDNHVERVYGGMIRALDRGVGRVMAALKKNGLAKNTLVIITSDNGAPGYMGLKDVNAPYRGWKLTYFQGGLRVPLYMQWPARLQPGQMYNKPVQGVDIFSTVAGAAGAPLPTDRKMDGVNLIPYVTGKKTGRPHDTLFWRDGTYFALLDGHWKLQVDTRRKKTWLFNLKPDPTEQHNLASTHPGVVTRLKKKLDTINSHQVKPNWQPALVAPVSIDKTNNAEQAPSDTYIYWTN